MPQPVLSRSPASDRKSSSQPRAISLVDVKNMYVSCESLFDLSLRGRPVAVWSNGDGCAVARSDEAKALGVKMGTPKFKLRELLENGTLIGRSSNYTLYADMSRRLQEVLARFSPHVEIYSVDESFVSLDGFTDPEAHARDLVRAVARDVGLPVRVGIGPTKTLAKVANEVAKKNPVAKGVFDMRDPATVDWTLERFDVGEVWGIGRATVAKLAPLGISTAAHLRDMPLKQARAIGTVVLERTVRELQGECCTPFEDITPDRKCVSVTRTAGAPITEWRELMEALTAHTTRAAEKLRREGLVAGRLRAFYHTYAFRTSKPQHSVARTTALVPMTDDTLDLVAAARRCAEAGWIEGHPFEYGKVGVLLENLVPFSQRPRTLFEPIEKRDPRLMQAMDGVNSRFGRKMLTLASEGTPRARAPSWGQRFDDHSPRYTTRLSDLPVITRGRVGV